MIGGAIDELIRHHPWLKAVVFDSLKSTISKLQDLGSGFIPPPESKHWYTLAIADKPVKDDDVVMEDVHSLPSETGTQQETIPALSTSGNGSGDDTNGQSDDIPKAEVNLIVSFIDVLGRVRPQ